jgi:hypothetical protein
MSDALGILLGYRTPKVIPRLHKLHMSALGRQKTSDVPLANRSSTNNEDSLLFFHAESPWNDVSKFHFMAKSSPVVTFSQIE